MTATSAYPNAFQDPGIRALFGAEQRLQAHLDVEAALALAQGDLGMIPPEAAQVIARHAQLAAFDRTRMAADEGSSGHGLLPLIWELARRCGDDAGRYVHWGATTQNIVQTSHILQVHRAYVIHRNQLALALRALADLAQRGADLVMAGRTHGQHALPITFGFKVAGWIDDLARQAERLRACEPRVFVAMYGGAVGTLAAVGEAGLAVQQRLGERLGLGAMPLPSRALHDHQAEYTTLMGLLAASVGRIAGEIFTLMKPEFGEVEEPIPTGAIGSSTMPQKRNPRLTAAILSDTARVRALVPLALEGMLADHEGDATSGSLASHAVEQSAILIGDILQRLIVLIAGLEIFPAHMARNLALSDDLLLSEALMVRLADAVGRQQAHEIVVSRAHAAQASGQSFRALVSADPTITTHLTSAQIAEALDPLRYTGLSQQFAHAGRDRARQVAESIATPSGLPPLPSG